MLDVTRNGNVGGTWGRILKVNLTTRTIAEQIIDSAILKSVIGGAGLGAYLLYHEGSAEDRPFDPGNPLIFSTGPFQATQLPGSAKWTVVSRSPLSNAYGESAAGANWGIALKRSGYDAIVITGVSAEPVYLVVGDRDAEIRPASRLWGHKTSEVMRAIKEELASPRASVAVIGPGGENLVRYACIMVDGHSAAGRTGMGAVMGSKKLKAISLLGEGTFPETADLQRLQTLRKVWIPAIRERTVRLNSIGTPGFMPISESFGNIPTKNWTRGVWPEGNTKLGPTEYAKILISPVACSYCPVACHRSVKVTQPTKYRMEGVGPEYETLALIGQNCLIDSLPAVCKLNEACNEYGLDTISTGSCIAFTMECFEKGFLTAADNDGAVVEWGDADAALKLVQAIATRTRLGGILAEGTVRASQAIHDDTLPFAVAVKGVDLPAHNPRAFWAHAINYATGIRGACHERGNLTMPYLGLTIPELGIDKKQKQFTLDGVARLTARAQDWSSFWNSLVVCRFMGFTFSDMVDGLNAATGWGLDIEEAATAAERIFNLQRLVNLRDGITAADDVLPKRLFEPVREGPLAGRKLPDIQSTVAEYYQLRGWNSNGVPSSATLQRLGLNDLL